MLQLRKDYMEKKKIYCFDFDGTLTTSDTLLEFIKYAKGTGRFLMVFLMYSPMLVLMKLHLYPNWKAKQKIFAHLFGGMRIEKFDALCREFATERQDLLRPQGIKRVHECLNEGDRVMVVSASIDNWVRPFFSVRGLDGIEVLGTQIEVTEGKVTGRFASNNCYGIEKVRRIAEALRLRTLDADTHSALYDHSPYYIEAFGDSRGDREMIAFANKGHYKPFRD